MNIRDEILHNPKIAATVSAITTGTGSGMMLNWIPDDIGKLSSLIGIILAIILIRVHWVTLKKSQLELEIMKRKEIERKEAVNQRKEKGKPLRREDDYK